MADVTASLTADNTWKSSVITGVTKAAIWKESVDKVYHTHKYLPVTEVATRPNTDGSVWRSMKMIATGDVILEDIFINEKDDEIKFHVLDKDGKRTTMVHVNKIREEEGGVTLEYYNVDTATNEKTPLKGTSAFVNIAEKARAACANH